MSDPMPFDFDNPEVALAIEAGITALVTARMVSIAPRWATVTAIDDAGDSCTVDLGDDGTRPAAMHMIRPRAVGDVVLIEGGDDDRRVVDVKGGLGVVLGAGDTGDVKWSRSTSSAGYGWLSADGSTVIPAKFTALIALLGGSVVPDLRDRMPIGSGNTYSAGATGGSTTATIGQANLPAVSFAVTLNKNDPGHYHYDGDNTTGNTAAAGSAKQEPGLGMAATTSTNVTNMTFTSPVAASGGSGTPLTILNPYVGLKPYIHV